MNQDKSQKKKVPIPLRWEVVHMRRNGSTYEDIKNALGIPISTAQAIYQKWEATGDVEDLERSGRPKVITEDIQDNIVEIAKNHPDKSLSEMEKIGKDQISKTSRWRVLKSQGFNCVNVSTKWKLLTPHRIKRNGWAKIFIKLPDSFWARVVFTDECIVKYNPKKQKVWITKGTRVSPIQRDRWGYSVMIWGGYHLQWTCYSRICRGYTDK